MVVAIALTRVMPNVSKRLVAIVPIAEIRASRYRKRRKKTRLISPRENMNKTQNSAATTTAPVQNSNGSRLVAPHRVRATCPTPIIDLLTATPTPILKARNRSSAAGRPDGTTACTKPLTSDESYCQDHDCDCDPVPGKRPIRLSTDKSDQAGDR